VSSTESTAVVAAITAHADNETTRDHHVDDLDLLVRRNTGKDSSGQEEAVQNARVGQGSHSFAGDGKLNFTL